MTLGTYALFVVFMESRREVCVTGKVVVVTGGGNGKAADRLYEQ